MMVTHVTLAVVNEEGVNTAQFTCSALKAAASLILVTLFCCILKR